MNNSKTLIRDLKTIGKRLHDIRKTSGLSREEVATRAGISGRTYADIERGETNPRLDTNCHLWPAKSMMNGDYFLFVRIQ